MTELMIELNEIIASHKYTPSYL